MSFWALFELKPLELYWNRLKGIKLGELFVQGKHSILIIPSHILNKSDIAGVLVVGGMQTLYAFIISLHTPTNNINLITMFKKQIREKAQA